MEIVNCPDEQFESDECRVFKKMGRCFMDIHHKQWPERDYKTPLEKEFRELDTLKVLGCRALHQDHHATVEPPIKPSVDDMREAVNDIRVISLAERIDNDLV